MATERDLLNLTDHTKERTMFMGLDLHEHHKKARVSTLG